jgi:hypothetical protein
MSEPRASDAPSALGTAPATGAQAATATPTDTPPAPASPGTRRGALLLVLALATGAFGLAILAPYRVDTDTGFQLRALEQWQRGESPSPGTLRLPDADDLSRDALVWSSWWPPGFPFLYAPLAATGLSLAAALRLTSFLLFLAGAAGWMRLAGRLGLTAGPLLLFAASVAACAVTVGGAISLRSTDNLTFAGMPWLMLLVLRSARTSPAPGPGLLWLCGLSLGATYLLKYTFFLAALAAGAWLALQLLRRGAQPTSARLLRTAALCLGIVLPVIALIGLSAWQSGRLAESATGARSLWQAEDLRSAQPLPLLFSFLGAPGLALFQSHLWITHLLYFSDRYLRWLRPLDLFQRLMLKSLLGAFGTLTLAWALTRRPVRALAAASSLAASARSLALTTVAGFYLVLAAVSLAVQYNYLANEPRYAIGVLPLLHPFVLLGLLAAASQSAGAQRSSVVARGAAWAALVVFFAAPLAFAAGIFWHSEVAARRSSPYTAGSTGLYLPELSRNVPELQAAVAALLRTPRDVVVIAGPAGWGASFIMWLDLPGRTLPISTFSLPLGGSYHRAADLRAATPPLTTTRPLRVVLVAALDLQRQGWLARLMRRFPQARAWTAAPAVRDAAVGIWWSDLLAAAR